MVLAPLAFSTHLWSLANAPGLTVFATLALRTLALPAVAYGAVLAVSGVAMFLSATAAPRLGRRFGAGRTIIAARGAYPVAWAGITVATTVLGQSAPTASTIVLFAASAVQGVAAGCENANEMSLRQTATPDELLGRMNRTMRSANRTLAAVGAIGGGALMTVADGGVALLVVTVVFVAAAVDAHVLRCGLRSSDSTALDGGRSGRRCCPFACSVIAGPEVALRRRNGTGGGGDNRALPDTGREPAPDCARSSVVL